MNICVSCGKEIMEGTHYCSECYDATEDKKIRKFAKWLSERSNNLIYLKLVEEFLNDDTD